MRKNVMINAYIELSINVIKIGTVMRQHHENIWHYPQSQLLCRVPKKSTRIAKIAECSMKIL